MKKIFLFPVVLSFAFCTAVSANEKSESIQKIADTKIEETLNDQNIIVNKSHYIFFKLITMFNETEEKQNSSVEDKKSKKKSKKEVYKSPDELREIYFSEKQYIEPDFQRFSYDFDYDSQNPGIRVVQVKDKNNEIAPFEIYAIDESIEMTGEYFFFVSDKFSEKIFFIWGVVADRFLYVIEDGKMKPVCYWSHNYDKKLNASNNTIQTSSWEDFLITDNGFSIIWYGYDKFTGELKRAFGVKISHDLQTVTPFCDEVESNK